MMMTQRRTRLWFDSKKDTLKLPWRLLLLLQLPLASKTSHSGHCCCSQRNDYAGDCPTSVRKTEAPLIAQKEEEEEEMMMMTAAAGWPQR